MLELLISSRNSYNYLSDFNRSYRVFINRSKRKNLVAILTITFLISTLLSQVRIESVLGRNSYNYLSDFNMTPLCNGIITFGYISRRNSYNYLSDFNIHIINKSVNNIWFVAILTITFLISTLYP